MGADCKNDPELVEQSRTSAWSTDKSDRRGTLFSVLIDVESCASPEVQVKSWPFEVTPRLRWLMLS